WRNGKNQCHR
ncbi:bacterial regulatory helix-turn-helix, lysR family protein, partial [Vibrio parahaemolyticus EKP-021]